MTNDIQTLDLDTFTQIQSKIIQANDKNAQNKTWPMIRSWFFESIVNYYSLDMCYIFSKSLDPKQMEKALSQTLNHYSALSGRVHYKGYYKDQYIDMNNEGVEMIVCHQPNVGYKDLIKDREESMIRGRYCKILNGETIMDGKAPLLTLQLTFLEKGGCVLGVCISHSIVDGGSFSTFMQDLSKMYQNLDSSLDPLEEPMDLYSRMSSSTKEILNAVTVMKYKPLSLWKSFALRSMYSWAFYFLRKQKAYYPHHCPPRFCLSFSKEELQYIKDFGMKQTKQQSEQNWVSTNEALVVHIWTMLLDVCELPMEQRCDLGISVIVNPRGRSKYVPERVLGSIGFGVHYAIDMSSPSKYTQIHDLFRWAVSDDVVNASIVLLESGMSRNRFDPIYINSRTSSELPYGLSRWNLNPQTLKEGNVFGLNMDELVGTQSWNTGEVYKVVMRVDGGCDAYINKSQNPVMGNMVSNWPLVRLMGPDEYFRRLCVHHEQFQKQVANEIQSRN